MKQVGTLVEALKAGELLGSKHENPYVTEALAYDGILFTPAEAKSRFPDLFATGSRPVFLEVGAYLGKNLMEMATDYPESNFLGLEITYKRAVKCARKISRGSLGNARISLCEAREFLRVIPAATLSGVCVFFPDPWPKKKHAKNRLVRTEFLELSREKLVPNGFVWLKTDSEQYYLEALECATLGGWRIEPDGGQPAELQKRCYETAFEALFKSQNLPRYQFVARR